jgi:hypothetical protein
MKVNKEQDKHRHHKQPQFFLKGFAAVGNSYQKKPDIWVYKKGEDYKDGVNPSLESVNDTGYGEDFYAYIKDDGSKDFNKYENLLMKEFEQPAQPALEKIRRLEEINEDERELFIKYVASMKVRGDWWKNVSDKIIKESSAKTKREFLDKYKNKIPRESKQEEIDEIVDKRVERLENNEFHNENMIKAANDVASIIRKMNWRLLIAPKNMPYLTSDNPVYYFELDTIDSELLFPVSSNITLSLSWKTIKKATIWKWRSKNIWDVNDTTVSLIRHHICSIAINEVYFSEKRKWLVDFINRRNRQ